MVSQDLFFNILFFIELMVNMPLDCKTQVVRRVDWLARQSRQKTLGCVMLLCLSFMQLSASIMCQALDEAYCVSWAGMLFGGSDFGLQHGDLAQMGSSRPVGTDAWFLALCYACCRARHEIRAVSSGIGSTPWSCL